MGVYIDNFEPKNGLYQIDQGKIHKFKGKGGTVRVYPIQQIDLVRCGECKKVDTKKCPMYSAGWGYTDDDWCSEGERRADGDI